ncbi:hypothetical protein TrVE_jg3452 [Triparma verrucosa]|uniref:Uncharacterized protein n=1 Tax=Triparma verrucosa TaxID=1606542 RepID=A0A9W7EU55_9STRA|nr:hypothetical protein TrVE_jg3452 [Triparma verrucosa]
MSSPKPMQGLSATTTPTITTPKVKYLELKKRRPNDTAFFDAAKSSTALSCHSVAEFNEMPLTAVSLEKFMLAMSASPPPSPPPPSPAPPAPPPAAPPAPSSHAPPAPPSPPPPSPPLVAADCEFVSYKAVTDKEGSKVSWRVAVWSFVMLFGRLNGIAIFQNGSTDMSALQSTAAILRYINDTAEKFEP